MGSENGLHGIPHGKLFGLPDLNNNAAMFYEFFGVPIKIPDICTLA